MMRKMQLWLALIVLFGAVGFLPAQAEDNWGRLAAISATIGVNANRVCVGEASRGDIGCASNAPFVDPATGYLGLVTNSPSSTLHVGSTWISSTITLHPSINTGAAASYKTSIYSQFSTNNAFGILVNGYTLISTTGNAYSQIQYGSTDTIRHWFAGGRVVIGGPDLKGIYPSTTLDVKGTVKIADGGEACDTNRAGAIKYASAVFSFCNGSAWQTLAEAAGGATTDRITSGTTAVVANTTGYISLTTGGITTGYLDTLGRLQVPSVIATDYPGLQLTHANGQIRFFGEAPAAAKWAVGSSGDATDDFMIYDLENSKVALLADDITGNVGIGTLTPSKTFTVNGDADVSGTMKLAGTGSETCGTGSFGQIRLNPATGKLELCRQ